MPLCLAAGAASAVIAANAFTLAWTHSIEKTRWEEDWRIETGALVVDEARIRGSGAGMEPPAGARLENGTWHYVPAQTRHVVLRLTHSPHAAGYELCTDRGCRLLADLLPGLKDNPDTTAVIELTACSEGARS